MEVLTEKIMGKPLEKEFKFYIEHQEELVKKYNGRVIVIKDGKVLGAYDSDMEAITETTKIHELGTFLVKKCEPGEESYTEVFHSRIAFV
jgi:energy-coupling factor transporter ATP-binding protein EcfA2